MSSAPFLRRLRLRNYRSIESCDIELGQLTILVGRNGAGKSNFLDSLRFVMESLQSSLEHAIKTRGGLQEVRRRGSGPPHGFAIQLELDLGGIPFSYGFEVVGKGDYGFVVKREALESATVGFRALEGKIDHITSAAPLPATPDRLYLVHAAGLPGFREVYDNLLSMGFYNFNPEQMKQPQTADAGELLHRDGSNIASVIARLQRDPHSVLPRINQYLHTIVPELAEVRRVSLGAWETLEFEQARGTKHPSRFYAASMSDGTLRSLGALLAVAQRSDGDRPASLVGIEEPETALHPAAAGALMDALREATTRTQVVITSHSPDLLDQVTEEDRLLAVQSVQGITQVGIVDRASRDAIKNHLYTPGDLLRMDQLAIDRDDLARQQALTTSDRPSTARPSTSRP